MATDLDTLLSSIRDCQTYDAVQNRLAVITEHKRVATVPDVVRALRDAQVYALVWGVFVAALELGAPIVARDKARKALDAALVNDDENAHEAAFIAYEAACGACYKVQDVAASTLDKALESVTHDASTATSGENGTDALADAAAAELASSDISEHLRRRNVIYDSASSNADPYQDYYDRERQIRNITRPVQQACEAYVNDHVIRAKVTAELKQSLNRYLLVWRKTTTGGGNPLAAQGILESIDEKNGTFVLRSLNYKDQRETVSFEDIGSIDTSRTRSGALSSAVAPTWRNAGIGQWVRSDQY